MSQQETFPMTKEGQEKLKAELENLKVNKRPKVVERIRIARSYGDLSENYEYESAKNEQSMLENKISTIDHMLQHVEIINPNKTSTDEVSLGKRVTFKELPDEDPETYQIVGAAEADPMNEKISNESPIAQSLIGHKTGEQVDVPIPDGSMKVQIIAVD